MSQDSENLLTGSSARLAVDVFNGDADGLCALQQLRLADPRPEARIVTGVKRDIALLSRLIDIQHADITVLDISLDRNREPLASLLARGNRVVYIDHHFSGIIPTSNLLETHIDTSPKQCTSLIVDRLLQGQYRPWAIAGAYGDNLDAVAGHLASVHQIAPATLNQLKEIGRLLNYNGYGFSVDDLLAHPADLFRELQQFEGPVDFFHGSKTLPRLRPGFHEDLAQAKGLQPLQESASGRVFQLPQAPWARRVVGVFSNQLARDQPELAHATLLPVDETSFLVSVRAPLQDGTGADTLCRQFPTGGGRAAAAGINKLPREELDHFLALFARHFK